MTIILISASHDGVGKTTLAKRLKALNPTTETFALADTIRLELEVDYPSYNWFDKTSEGKKVVVKETGKTIREMLIERGEARCKENHLHWCNLWVGHCNEEYKDKCFIIDDVRKEYEAKFFQDLGGVDAIHFHIHDPSVLENKVFPDCVHILKEEADYVINATWR